MIARRLDVTWIIGLVIIVGSFLLGTFCDPHLTSFDCGSIFMASLLIVPTMLTWRDFPVPFMVRGIAAISAPIALAVLALLGQTSRGLDNGIYEIVCLVFGFTFALNCFELPDVSFRVVGWVFTLFHGLLLVMFMSWPCYLVWCRPKSLGSGDALAYSSGIGFILLWTPILVLLERKARRRMRQRAGHCEECGYNLTGNVSGTCPECGTTIQPRDPVNR